jgi:hypothetical protein
MMNVPFLRNVGSCNLPRIKPECIPNELKFNISKISIVELKKLCDAWCIKRKGLTKSKDLQDAIQSHFGGDEKKEEKEEEKKEENNNLSDPIIKGEKIFTSMNIKSFINYIIKFDNVDDIIKSCSTQSEKGFIFERLFDIIIKFGFCGAFSNSNYFHLIGNSNNSKLQVLENLNQYLAENVLSGNSSGCSDITLRDKNGTYIFISCKYFEDASKQNSIYDYDIQNIVAMAAENKHIYKKYKIFIVVNDKVAVLSKVKSANKSSKYITDHMIDENILDKKDLNKYFLLFKKSIIKNEKKDWQVIYLNRKEKLELRFHQELIIQKTSDLIEEGNKSFLWGCKCRSGKTYMIGGIIVNQLDIKKKLNVLIITPAPSETTPQFTNDLFNKFNDFDEFKVHHIEGSKSLNNIDLSINNIFIVSKQLLQKYINDKTIMKIKSLKLDIIGFDENHFSGTTDLSKDILRSYSSKNTIKIYLTATYNKPLYEWNITEECQMFWDIEDEQICKSILVDNGNIIKLQEKHGKYVKKTIDHYQDLGLTIDEMFNSYGKMPDLHLITNMFDQQRYQIIKEKLNNNVNNKMGFCFDTLLGLNKAKTRFSFENEVKTILRYISGSHKETDGEKTIFPRINNICSTKESRIPFTQIWFLPSNNINEISLCLETLMSEDLILKKYDVFRINRKNQDLAKDVKAEINKKEIEARERGKLGLILLAGNMLTLGITLNLCDLVILMNSTLSSDKILQQMYRCMTEGEDKKIGFVVDLNISRVLNTCINYTIYKENSSIDGKMNYLIKNHLINIDVDMMENKKLDSDAIVKKLMTIWKEDPINSFKNLLKNLDNDYVIFDNSIQRKINKVFTKTLKSEKVNLKVRLKDESDPLQDLPSGRERVKDDTNNKNDQDKVGSDDKKEEIQVSFTKDVLPFVIPLVCILTIKKSNKDFVEMLDIIKENPQLLDTFNDQCLIWWNQKDLIDLIKDILIKYFFNKNSITYNISVQFKMSLQSLIDRPKELLELINDCLKPKDIEKKQFGEVFTPMFLIDEMLDKLPTKVWRNSSLKWLDPATGMGNFPVAVYLRLMDGLKKELPLEKDRKKHILENMLYMCELNKKNVLICNQIFDLNDEYKLNLYQGDSLKLDYNKEFGVEYFDIIVGNPPYNSSGTKASGNTIWQLFVIMCVKLLKKSGYMCFVHPNGWRKPNTKKGKFYGLFEKMTKENTLVYLEIHDTKDGMKQFKCGTRYDWYILQKRKNENHRTKIIDQNKVYYEINLNKYNWLANCELELIDKLIANENEEKCKILYSRSNYGADKKWISKVEKAEFKYPVVHSTPKCGHRFVWSSRNDNGFYGIKKVIFGDGGINNPIIDIDGKYGMTQHSMALIIDDIKEGEKIYKFICSSVFGKILKACLWSSFAIEWGMFKDLKKNFYELLDNDISPMDENEPMIIKDGRKQYYLINQKLYKVKKDKSQGKLFGSYENDIIIEKRS